MSLKQLSGVFAAVFLLVGVLGFVPGITSDGHLLGIFEVDTVHNIIHLASGLAALAAMQNDKYAQMYFQVFGVVYALVAVLGFVLSGEIILTHVNMADNLLHVAIAAAALGIGFGMKPAAE